MRLRVAALIVGAAVLMTWAATEWDEVRPPSTPVNVAGTDVELRVDPVVPTDQVDDVVAGFKAVHALLASADAQQPREPVEARLSYRSGCTWFVSPDAVSTAWVDGLFLCLNAGHPNWRAALSEDDAFPASVAAHEYVHTAQTRWGCEVAAEDHQWLWLYEGMVDHLAYLALQDAGLVGADAAQQRIVRLGGLDPELLPLSSYERRSPDSGQAYPLFHAGAREATEGMDAQAAVAAFRGFCVDAGAGNLWRIAFNKHFGREVDEVYQAVAERVAQSHS